jgi:hypothetical protein
MHRKSASCAIAALATGASLLAFAPGCGGSTFQANQPPANIAGDYSVSLTNGNNGCQFANWTQGSTAQDVHVMLAQQGASATATLTGLAGLLFYVVLGTVQFQGTVSGDSFTLTAVGSNPARDGMCTFTIKATLTGSTAGDTIQGQLAYTETTNGSPDCSYHSTCSSIQSFAGARPPAADAGSD